MSQNDQGMSPERRRDQILAYLSAHDHSSVSDLSQVLGVSEVTVRKDLDQLEAQGVLTRVHGGAVVSGRGRLELYFAEREQEHLEEKRRIAQAAAALIQSGQRIFLDASTTALQVARLIKDRDDLNEAQLKQQIVNASGLVVGIVDSSKFGTRSFSAFALPHEIDRIITDEHALTAGVKELRAAGIQVDLV